MFYKRWMVVLIGNESGSEIEMPWLRFWLRRDAEAFVRKSNRRLESEPLTRYEVRKK